jgi:hypothetical protein
MTGQLITPGGVMRLLALTLRAPGAAAAILVGLNLTRAVLWQALALVTVLSVLIVAFSPGPMPEAGPIAGPGPVVLTPFAYVAVLGASLVMLVFAIYYTGAALGGTGTFPATLTLVVWLEVLATAIRVVQTVALLVSPLLGGLVSLAGLGLLFWTLVNFVNVLHGFGSLGKALLTLLLAVVGISLGVAVILSLIGAGLPGGPLNV